MANYMIARFDEIDAVRCPCGFSRRAFVSPDNPTATMHVVDVQENARVHYHKKLTEIYFILEGAGQMELDGRIVSVKSFTPILIKPGCRHRAIGKMRILNVSIHPSTPKTNGSNHTNVLIYKPLNN